MCDYLLIKLCFSRQNWSIVKNMGNTHRQRNRVKHIKEAAVWYVNARWITVNGKRSGYFSYSREPFLHSCFEVQRKLMVSHFGNEIFNGQQLSSSTSLNIAFLNFSRMYWLYDNVGFLLMCILYCMNVCVYVYLFMISLMYNISNYRL